MKPLVVGEAPGRRGGPPLAGDCGQRLADFYGVSLRDFKRTFTCVNLLREWPGSAGKGSRFPLAEAKVQAERIAARLPWGRVVILLGRRVASAFGVKTDYFRRARIGKCIMVFVVPHPSRVNRWFNDPANVDSMRAFMRTMKPVSR
jgi:uracil-DNA glycosylase